MGHGQYEDRFTPRGQTNFLCQSPKSSLVIEQEVEIRLHLRGPKPTVVMEQNVEINPNPFTPSIGANLVRMNFCSKKDMT